MTMRVTCNVMKSLNTPQTFVDVDSNDLHQRCDIATIKKNKIKKKKKKNVGQEDVDYHLREINVDFEHLCPHQRAGTHLEE